MPATWSCGSTATHPTSPPQKDILELLDTISSVPSLHLCLQQLPTLPLTMHAPINVLCQFMKPVLASAIKAELGILFLNAKHACPLCIALHKLGHPQPTTPIQTDNTTATGIANDNIKQKWSKSIDMNFYWVCDCICQGQYHIFSRPGITNKVDYFTKHHPDSHHQNMHPAYLHASANAFECLQSDDTDHRFGEGVFMASNQAWQYQVH